MAMGPEERDRLRAAVDAVAALRRGECLRLPNLPDCGTPEIDVLYHECARMLSSFSEADGFLRALAKGDLDTSPPPKNHLISPFKELHANLRHLVWQTEQVAGGDLNQRVDFLGTFSTAFNSMVESLREKRRVEERLQQMAITDELTGIFNRRHLIERMELEFYSAYRYDVPVSVVMIDIDHFKAINDHYGHQVGDRALTEVARKVRGCLRKSDILGRYGGEEFAAVLPHTRQQDAMTVGENMRVRVEGLRLEDVHDLRVTISGGVAGIPDCSPTSLDDLVRMADSALYQAKTGGRNTVVGEPSP